MTEDQQARELSRSSQWLQLIAVLFIALALRAVFLDRTAVEHFDEGVYASNLFFSQAEGSAYPQRHLYAPPLVPALLEWSETFFGYTSVGTMLPGVVFGTLTVVLVFHVASSWFGNEAAWPTAIVAALSEFHIIYSRAALTDVVLGCFLLLAVYLGTEAVRYRKFGLAVVGGLACALAWWSKYSGWLPIAIVATATTIWIALHRKHSHPLRAIGCVVLMSVVAVAAWSPVWFGLEEHGGYAAVQANHQRYVVGFGGWLESARQQFNAHRVLDSWLAWSSLAFAALFNIVWQLRSKDFTWNQSSDDFELSAPLLAKVVLGAVLLSLLAAAGVGTTWILFCLALGGLAGRLRWPAIPVDSEEASNEDAIARWTLPCWIVVVWLGSLTLMVPTYRAYPRLTLPWLIAVWLGAGAGISWWVRANLRWHGRKGTKRPVVQQNLMMIVLCVLAGYIVIKHGKLSKADVAAWKPRAGIRTLAEKIVNESITDRQRVVVYTYGEPALFYHLSAMNILTKPVSSVPTTPTMAGGTPLEVLLVEGPHARRSDGFNDDSATIMRLYERAASFDIPLSDLVQLNERDAAKMLGSSRETDTFHVWRLKLADKNE